jgi:hypothetical protein
MAELCCPGCRTTVRDGDRFCAECGTPVARSEQAGSGADTPAPPVAEYQAEQAASPTGTMEQEAAPFRPAVAARFPSEFQSEQDCPLRLEVRLAHELPLGSQGMLDVRLSRRGPAGDGVVEFEISRTFEPHRNTTRELDLRSTATVAFSEPFLASSAGMHQFTFLLMLADAAGPQVWEGRVGLTVAGPSTGNVINVVDQRQITGRVVVGTEGTQLNLGELARPGIPQAGAFEDVVLSRRQRVDTLHSKSVLPGCEVLHRPYSSLAWRFREGKGMRNVCLVARPQIGVGKQRRDPKDPAGNDIVLRPLPPTPSNKALTDRLSRKHALIRFTPEGLVWQNLDCRNGTLIDEILLGPAESRQLTQGVVVRPAGIVPLQCTLFYGDPVESDPSYTRFESRLPGAASPPSVGRVRAARLRRQDELPVREEYLLFQRAIGIGSDPSCALHINHDSVASMHAQILLLGGGLWLEVCQTRKPTWFGDRQIPPDCLVPLRPNQSVVLGDVEIAVRDFLQEYIDT